MKDPASPGPEFVRGQQQDLSQANLSSISKSDFRDLKELYYGSSPREGLKCRLHDDFLTLYCKNDQETFCVQCLFAGQAHKGHSVAPIKMSSDEMSRDRDEFNALVQEKIKQMAEALNASTANKSLLEKLLSQYHSAIESEFQGLHKALQLKEQEYKMQVSKLFSDGLAAYEALVSEYHFGIENCLELVNFPVNQNVDLLIQHKILQQLSHTISAVQTSVRCLEKSDFALPNLFQVKQQVVQLLDEHTRCKKLPDLFANQTATSGARLRASELYSEKFKKSIEHLDNSSNYSSPLKNSYMQNTLGQFSTAKAKGLQHANLVNVARFNPASTTAQKQSAGHTQKKEQRSFTASKKNYQDIAHKRKNLEFYTSALASCNK